MRNNIRYGGSGLMAIDAYSGISQEEIQTHRITSEGKTFTLNHPNELVVSMRYKGTDKPSSNSQGWERSSSYYFNELQSNHPEYFSPKNTIRIENGKSPRVDAQFVKSFPQYKGFENETLIHHHVGKDGQAVAVPASIHKGSGEIHSVENTLGVTKNAQRFSEYCKHTCDRDASYLGKTSVEFKSESLQQSQTASSGKGTFKQNSTISSVEQSSISKQNAISRATESKKSEKRFPQNAISSAKHTTSIERSSKDSSAIAVSSHDNSVNKEK